MTGAIGTNIALPDAEARVVGTLEFVLDHRLEGMLHARVVRSNVPHARILGYDVEDARSMPGVIDVITGADVAGDPSVDPYFGAPRPDQPFLAQEKVRYAGEPVALIIAETREQASAALTMVDVEYEELPFVTRVEEAVADGAPVIHDRWPDNNTGSWKLKSGDFHAAVAAADHVFTDTYYSPPASHVPMEPFVTVAHWSAPDAVEVWTSAQSPHAVKEGLEQIFQLPDGAARVHVKNLGGGYGGKGQVKIEPMTAYAARRVGRPVKLELARDEVFLTVGKHAASIDITTAVTNDGKILARKVFVNYNAGAYAITSVAASGQGLTRANGPYTIPNVEIESVATYTNTVPCGPFRGAMTSQLAFAYESQIDDIAARIEIDPIELRRRNILRNGDLYPTGEAMHDMYYAEMLDDLETAIEWTEPSAPASPTTRRGKGVGIMIKNTMTPSRSEARLEFDADGKVYLYSSSVEMGQGASGSLIQITADALDIPPENVEFDFPDTRYTPFDTTTSSSRTTFSMGQAIERAAEDLEHRIRKAAANVWGVSDHEVRTEGGEVILLADPTRRETWASIVSRSGETRIQGSGEWASKPGVGVMLQDDPHDVKGEVTAHWHQGGAAAEIEVDIETGKIEILRAHASCYAGRVVNPHRVKQQNEGCIVMGIGGTIYEELVYQDGTLSNPNLSDYMIPSIVDVPAVITSTAIESEAKDAEIHGIGEMAIPAVAPAISNALFHATGVRITDLPLTPERVLAALEDAGITYVKETD